MEEEEPRERENDQSNQGELAEESPRTRENQKLGVISNFRCGCVVRMPSMINERYPLD